MAEEPPPSAPLSPEPILKALDRHGVRYVLIGGLAAIAQGWPGVTLDADITPASDRENLGHLAAALREMGARLPVAGIEEGVEIPLDARTFDLGVTWTFITRYGPVDVALRPDGIKGYDDLARGAKARRAFGVDVPVAALEDIIRSKEAANRDRDRVALPLLRRLLERSREREER